MCIDSALTACVPLIFACIFPLNSTTSNNINKITIASFLVNTPLTQSWCFPVFQLYFSAVYIYAQQSQPFFPGWKVPLKAYVRRVTDFQ